jgi:transcriptional regulator with XRE-family HTH domain
MKKKASFLERGKSVNKNTKIMVEHSMATVKEIWRIMDKLDIDQRKLADKLGKHESEISKWLSGTHNFTFATISKIEAVLGTKIITTISEAYTPLKQTKANNEILI